MQPNVSLIKKLMMHIDFLGKNLYPVGRAKLSSTSVVILMLMSKLEQVIYLVVVDPLLFRFVINEHLSLDPRVCYCNNEWL